MRRKDREITDEVRIEEIVAKTKVLHLGLHDEPFPYIVPLSYGYEKQDGAYVFYMHGAKEGHKVDLIRANPNVFVETECEIEMIPGDIACKYGTTFASFMGCGACEIVEDKEEKKHGLAILMQCQTGKTFEITDAMADMVAVFKVTCASYSVKNRKS